MTALVEYKDLLKEVDETAERLSHLQGIALRCSRGCAQCCTALTLLPLEAHAILAGTEGWGEPPSGTGLEQRCPLLTPDRLCRAYRVRPLICRARGFPVLFIDSEGKSSIDVCPGNRFPNGLSDGQTIPLLSWNARLFRINLRYCAEAGIPSHRIPMGDLYRVAGAWLRLADEPSARIYAFSGSP